MIYSNPLQGKTLPDSLTNISNALHFINKRLARNDDWPHETPDITSTELAGATRLLECIEFALEESFRQLPDNLKLNASGITIDEVSVDGTSVQDVTDVKGSVS